MSLTPKDLEIIAEIAKPKERMRILGLDIGTWIHVLTVVGFVSAFYIRTDDTMRRLVVTNEWLVKFADNNDRYNSARYGIPFMQGAPASYVNQKTQGAG